MLFGSVSYGQQILFVNDNDNITYNTDTIVNDLDHTTYSGFHYWSIPDSAGATPSAVFMNTFDLVIWYSSTDGVGLKIWDASSTSGNSELESYASGGKHLWIIGQDMLYQKYTTGSVFTTGEFAKDYMGLTSYDVQSYTDDASMGCPQMERSTTASSLFPALLKWQFSTLWYADGCTPMATTKDIYKMGPSTYALSGRKSMFHNEAGGVSVMSTLFDPALIDTFVNRVDFLQKSITYILGTSATNNTFLNKEAITIFPNPVNDDYHLVVDVSRKQNVSVVITDIMGRTISTEVMALSSGKNDFKRPASGLVSGLYIVKLIDANGQTIYNGKLQKK